MNRKKIYSYAAVAFMGVAAIGFGASKIVSNASENQVTFKETEIDERYDICAGSITLGNSPTNIFYDGKNIDLINDYIVAESNGIVYYDYNEESNYSKPIVINDDNNAENLNLINDKIVYTTDGDVKIYDYKSEKEELVDELSKYEVESMYTVDNDYIYFSSNDKVYSYSLDSKETLLVDEYNGTELFIPTDKGIIFVSENDGKYSIIIDDKVVINNVEKTMKITGDDLHFYETVEDTSDVKEKKIDLQKLFNGHDDKDVIDVEEELDATFNKLRVSRGNTRSQNGVSNVLKKANEMLKNTWSPKKDMVSDKFGGFTLQAGSIQRGVPYSQPYMNGGYVGFNITLNQFNRMTQDVNSRVYTKNNEGMLYYGTDCSGFVSYCMGHNRLTTVGIHNSENYTHLGKLELGSIQTGDVFNRHTKNNHVILICGVDSKNIYTIEQTVPGTVYKETPISQLNTKFYDNRYTVYRYKNINSAPAITSEYYGETVR